MGKRSVAETWFTKEEGNSDFYGQTLRHFDMTKLVRVQLPQHKQRYR